jgi:phospholipase C
MFLFCILSLLLRTILASENRKFDRKFGTLAQQRVALQEAAARGEARQEVGLENYGPMYRYVL